MKGLVQKADQMEAVNWENIPVEIGGSLPITLYRGERIAIVGPNGAGKTSLLQALLEIQNPPPGTTVRVFGKDPQRFDYHQRRKCYSVAPASRPMFYASALENIQMNQDETDQVDIEKMLLAFGVEAFATSNALQLSGGQSARINIIRQKSHNGLLLLSDEPTAALDQKNAQKSMENLLRGITNCTAIVVTHDLELLHLFDRVIIMEQMQPVYFGQPEQAMKRLAAIYNLSEGDRRSDFRNISCCNSHSYGSNDTS